MIASKALQASLEDYGLPDIKTIEIKKGNWGGVFDLQEGFFLDVYAPDFEYPVACLASRTVWRLAVILMHTSFDQNLCNLLQEYGSLY